MELECAQCGRKFFWTPNQESDTPPTYHSETCRRAASEARRKVAVRAGYGETDFFCPTKDKVRHETWTSAGQVIDKVDNTMSAYRCLCGWIHVGHARF